MTATETTIRIRLSDTGRIREVGAVVAHDLAQHERRRPDREDGRAQSGAGGQQRASDGVREPEHEARERRKAIDRHGAGAGELADDRAHRVSKP